ncbi:MAG: phenylalanine--tRNA ligase subunit beta [Patescibacteria group bacterium]
MNSLVSYEWLKHYVNLRVTPEEFAKRMSLSGPAVERIIPQDADLAKIVVGCIKELKKHPNADKLRIVMTDVGGKKPAHIVCGGTNLEEGQYVAVALIGSKVRWHGQGDLVTLEPAEIRGEKSEGMICAADEIGLGAAFQNPEREILDLGKELGWGTPPKPGSPLADILGLAGDVVMDIEVTSNRVDAMGMVGLAREAAAILDRPFIWKEPRITPPASPYGKGRTVISQVPVKVATRALCPRYMAARVDGVTVGQSPWWMKRRLLSAGIRPINVIVDITNYVLLEQAQPMHAFDAATVEKGIEVRLARRGEKMRALDGKDYGLDDTMLVIADAAKPIAIAGVMGGERTGVMANTTSVIFEAATFDAVSIRRTSRKLGLQSDSQIRFEKGLSTEAPPAALARAIELTLDLAGGKLAGPVTDVKAAPYRAKKFSITTDEVNCLIGVALPAKEMVRILRALGFAVSTAGKRLTATVPWWRDHDIEMSQDLVEEIARVYGYGNIPAEIPFGLASRRDVGKLVWEDRSREVAKGAGFTETYSYSFVSKDLLEKAGYDASGMLHVQNPLTADLEIMRTTLLPSLLQAAAENREREHVLRLFEVANVYYPTKHGWKDLPDEQLELGALVMGVEDAWKEAKGFVEHLLGEMGMRDVSWRRLSTDTFWHPGRTVQAFVGGDLVATVGEVSPKIAERFKLDGRVALVDLPLEAAVKHATTARKYVPVSPYPSAKRDLAIVVDDRTEFDDVSRTIALVGSLHAQPLHVAVEWFDTYRGKNLPEGKKSLAMHIEYSAPDRTLESKDVDALMEQVVLALKEAFKAEVRG